METPELIRTFELEDMGEAVDFSPDNQILAVNKYGGGLSIWDVASTISPNGRWLATDASIEALTIIDLENKRELFTLGKEPAPIKSIS